MLSVDTSFDLWLVPCGASNVMISSNPPRLLFSSVATVRAVYVLTFATLDTPSRSMHDFLVTSSWRQGTTNATHSGALRLFGRLGGRFSRRRVQWFQALTPSFAHHVRRLALEALTGHEGIWHARHARDLFAAHNAVYQGDGLEGDGSDVDDEELVVHQLAGVGVTVAIGVCPCTIHNRLPCGQFVVRMRKRYIRRGGVYQCFLSSARRVYQFSCRLCVLSFPLDT